MLKKVTYIILICSAIIFYSCEDEVSPTSTSYVPIEAQLWGLEFQGYDGYIVADWEITNTSNYNISGWEIHTVITMLNDQVEKGFAEAEFFAGKDVGSRQGDENGQQGRPQPGDQTVK